MYSTVMKLRRRFSDCYNNADPHVANLVIVAAHILRQRVNSRAYLLSCENTLHAIRLSSIQRLSLMAQKPIDFDKFGGFLWRR